ncbi:thiopeptide-type bacteriocin biosynthesis protein [Actinomadura xylanilytica]|uniref:thiopeptide-type bacteriocin biosynthesis protein n=1 Tax=Actinomadura xylanilytica TaxID=887459 RepID=UPI00255AA99D|nr:thiopeptide-type bacteriocin biosynthesis protein [Actinomadura xylanilytica]MDL4773940.1 thiopeptide-type bacteriocin biosynthesis protein [Actinomadura xylanilytica]
MDERDWISAHAFHQGDQDRLIVEAVGPLATGLAEDGRISGWFFLRYWDGGPHVRVRLLPARSEDRPLVTEAVERRFEEFFRAHPSTPVMTERDYAEGASMLAAWERTEPLFDSLQPNDTLVHVPYRREHGRYGHGAAIEAVERHFAESSRLALDLLRQGGPPERRSTAAFAMLVLAWLTCEPDPGRLRDWISSGTRHFENEDVSPNLAPPEPSVRRLRTAVSLARRMRALAALADQDAGRPGPGALVDWTRSVAALRDVLRHQAERGALSPPGAGWEGPGGIVTAEPGTSVLTILDLCAHLVCNRLAVTLPEEIALRRLAGAAVSELAERT